jgi:hypothetical protein
MAGYNSTMERVERTSIAPVTSFLNALASSFRHAVASLESGRAAHAGWGEDVAFSDELERELIRRELHAG